MDLNLSNKKYVLLIFFSLISFLGKAQNNLSVVLDSLSGSNITTSSIITDNCKTGLSYFDLMKTNQNFYFNNHEYIFVKEYNEYSIYLSPPTRKDREYLYKTRKGLVQTEGVRPILFDKKKNRCYLIGYSNNIFDYSENKSLIMFNVRFNLNINAIVKLNRDLNPISAIISAYKDEYSNKVGAIITLAYFYYENNTYSRYIHSSNDGPINKNIAFDELAAILDIDIDEILSSKSKVQVIDKETMFIPGYPIPHFKNENKSKFYSRSSFDMK